MMDIEGEVGTGELMGTNQHVLYSTVVSRRDS